MEPIYCLTYQGPVNPLYPPSPRDIVNISCYIRMGDIFGYPVFNQWGTNGSFSAPPSECQW